MKIKAPWTVVVTIVAIVAGIVIMTVTGDNLSAGAKQIVIVQLLGIVSTILTLRKTENVSHELHNGLITDKVKDAVAEMADDPENTAVIRTETPSGDDDV